MKRSCLTMSTWLTSKGKPILISLLVFFLFGFFLNPGRVKADIAPYELPGGAALDPGEATTQVRMVAETVTLEVAPPNQETYPEARVTADFTLRNLGESAESIVVGFPLSCPECISDATGMNVDIDDLSVYVNTLQAATRLESLPYPNYFADLPINWAVFEVTFPPGQDVFIQVTYTAGGWGYPMYAYRTFRYILVTGAGWYDTIGSADIIVRLPYPANEQNTFLEQSGVREGSVAALPTISGNELRWHFENLEPTEDFAVTIVHPWQWYSALVERENVRLNPQDGEAWGRLGMAYKQMLSISKTMRAGPGGEAVYQAAIEAYEHATTLLPGDAMWHAGFAELLYDHFFIFDYLQNWDRPVDDLADLSRAVDETRRSLAIDPENELALDILDWVDFHFPGAVQTIGGKIDYPILTSTAGFTFSFVEPTATFLPTPTPRSTATPRPAASDTPTPVSAEVTPASAATKISGAPSAAPGSISPQATTAADSSASELLPLWVAAAMLVVMVGLGLLLRRNRA